MGMVLEDQQTFEGLVQHLKNAFHYGETISELISDFYGQTQKNNESEDVFAEVLQTLVPKIITKKPEFQVDANEQLRNQYAYKFKELFYAAIAHSTLQTADSTESFRHFWGCLDMTFSGRCRSGKTGSHTSSVEGSSCVKLEEAG